MFDTPEIYFPEIIRLYARSHPAKLALVVGEKTATWGQMEEGLCRVANALASRSIRRGDRVAVLAENSLEAFYAQLGILKLGGVVVSLSGSVNPNDLAAMLRDAEPRTIFCSEEHRAKVDGLRPVLETIPADGYIALEFAEAGWLAFPEFVAAAPSTWNHVPIYGEDLFYITYSSGTTSTPKGIALTHRSRVAYFLILAIELGVRSDAVVLAATALYSTTTWSMLLVAFICGATFVTPRRFDPAEFCDLSDQYAATHTNLVPAQYRKLLDFAGDDPNKLTTLRMTCSTGSKISRSLRDEMMRRFPGFVHEVYGMTEGIVTILKPSDLPQKADSVGTAMVGNDLRVVGTDDREVAGGEPGEIVGYSPSLLREYYKQPEKTLESTWVDPTTGRTFLRSGDIGRFDEDGFLYLVDRKKDMIVSGGFNVYPADIERVLAAHPQVVECCVIGIPHEKWDETPHALVILQGSATITPDELRAWVNSKVGRYQRLSSLELVTAFPRNAGGKILKRELRRPWWPDAQIV